jgi:hypothetical protein
MEEREKRRLPPSINVLSETLKRALPTKGLRIIEEILGIPIRTPISISVDPDLER